MGRAVALESFQRGETPPVGVAWSTLQAFRRTQV